jgi:hypothetical protein
MKRSGARYRFIYMGSPFINYLGQSFVRISIFIGYRSKPYSLAAAGGKS